MDTAAILAQCGLFASLDGPALVQLAWLCSTREVAGGEPVFKAGDSADYLYIVVTGRLRALRSDGGIAGDIARFEPIGEISVVTGEPRSSEVYALRDSLLLCVRRDQLMEFVARHPSALLEITRVLIHRLRQNQRQTALAAGRSTQTLALIPANPSVSIAAFAAFAERLGDALNAIAAPHRRVDSAAVDAALGAGTSQTPFHDSRSNQRLLDWLGTHEADGPRLLYCAGPQFDAWAERCLRQADRVLIVATGAVKDVDGPLQQTLRRLHLRAPIELALIHNGASTAGAIESWHSSSGVTAHHHLRPDTAGDYARMARQLSGRGLGLVLGGGGARGFAHIGLIRALEELKIPIDLVGGSSMGAFFSALVASGADSRELKRIAFDTFVHHNYLNDYVLPRVSLIRGRRFLTQLRAIFGERLIEDLQIPFFCVSTNLTRGTPMVHERGPLATWVGTSMAVPGVAPPVIWKGDLLADGAIVNSLPTDVMQALGRGPIIASDVSTEGGLHVAGIEGPDTEALLRRAGGGPHISLADILFRSATLTSESGIKQRAARADLYLRMPVSGIALFDWKRVDEIVERGYRHALLHLEGFQRGSGIAEHSP